eukprot:4865295-Amphidinium_carterae.4
MHRSIGTLRFALPVSHGHCPCPHYSRIMKNPRTQLARVKVVFVAPGMTSTCQPLDRAIMRPFKSALQYVCCKQFANNLLNTMEEENFVVKKSTMENRAQVVEWVVAAVRSVSARPALIEQAWSSISWQSKAVLESQSLRGTVPPELTADQADLEIADGDAIDVDKDPVDEERAITEEDQIIFTMMRSLAHSPSL